MKKSFRQGIESNRAPNNALSKDFQFSKPSPPAKTIGVQAAAARR
jgi:hypothetical protein